MTKANYNNPAPVRIGFVPLVDCAPLAVAFETGIFRERSLNVELMREPGWATIRDKMAYGELEMAHAPAGIAFALNWGLGVLRHPCSTGFLLNSNGDAITISKELSDQGVKDPDTLAEHIKTSQRESPITLGVPHRFSTHHFLLRQWLRPSGIMPGRDVSIVVLPPSLMTSCLASGDIDGYCVGEPFNTIAVRHNDGVILAESADLSPMHPEKALIVSEHYDQRNHEVHLEIIRAIADAATFCETPEGRMTALEILARPHYLGLDSTLIHSSLFAGDKNESSEFSSDTFHIFSHPEVNRPTAAKANWLVSEMRSADLLDSIDTKQGPPLSQIFREDIFDEAIAANQAVA